MLMRIPDESVELIDNSTRSVVMAIGLEWIDNGPRNSGLVRVLLDDQETTQLLEAVEYAVSGLKPPIYELPIRESIESPPPRP